MVKMDRQGRILIPAAVRKRIGARLFVLEEGEGDELRLKPIKEIRLTDFFSIQSRLTLKTSPILVSLEGCSLVKVRFLDSSHSTLT